MSGNQLDFSAFLFKTEDCFGQFNPLQPTEEPAADESFFLWSLSSAQGKRGVPPKGRLGRCEDCGYQRVMIFKFRNTCSLCYRKQRVAKAKMKTEKSNDRTQKSM